MTIYEINAEMLKLIDPETGELADLEAFENLQMAKDEKIENTALWIKELTAEADAIKAEEANLAERRRADERKAERLKSYLAFVLDGQKFSTPKCSVSFRKSKAVQVDDSPALFKWAEANNRDDLLTYSAPTISKKTIKECLESGEEIPYCSIQERQSVQVK